MVHSPCRDQFYIVQRILQGIELEAYRFKVQGVGPVRLQLIRLPANTSP